MLYFCLCAFTTERKEFIFFFLSIVGIQYRKVAAG